MENIIETQINADRESQVISNAAKITRRLEGDEVVIEIRVRAYDYPTPKDLTNTGSRTERISF